MDSILDLRFRTATHEAAQKIGILIVQGIQEELSGTRNGRWYPSPGNRLYDKEVYHSLPPDQKSKVNYRLKFTGARNRNDIIGAAYQASAPGEPPAPRTGRLRQSFFMIIEMLDQNLYEVSIRSNVFYADDLNYGTERLDPRPFIEPVIVKKMPEIVAIQHYFLYQILRGGL